MALCAFIFVTVCMHGDDSARATQFILVFDGDDASFLLVLSVRTPTSMIFFFYLDPYPGLAWTKTPHPLGICNWG